MSLDRARVGGVHHANANARAPLLRGYVHVGGSRLNEASFLQFRFLIGAKIIEQSTA